ncbi:MAG: hypothetical protein ACFE0Q_19820 [Anaerolineae bacterium]
MRQSFFWIISALLCITISANAQERFTDYSWTFSEVAFRYPASWEEPLQRFETENGRVNLSLAQTSVDAPETRPPAIPFVTLSILRENLDEITPYQALADSLRAVNINPIGALPGTLLDEQSIATRGTSSDGQLFGMGQALNLPDGRGLLLIYGRASSAQRDNFVGIFNAISNSVTLRASSDTPQYGVLWHQTSTRLDADSSYLDLVDIEFNGTLYALDQQQGILQLDPDSGQILQVWNLNNRLIDAVDLAVAPDGTLYIADVGCGCVQVIIDGTVVDTLSGFGLEAPQAITVTDDGTLYATDQDDTGNVLIYAYADITRSELPLDFPPLTQPLLAVNALGELVGLVDTALIYQINEDGVFSEQYQLTRNIFPTDFIVDGNNQLIVTTDGDGVLIFDALGNEINRVGTLTDGEPQAGELNLPQGIASRLDGTLYVADSDGSYGNITALSLNVETGRFGTSNLRAGVPVEGLLDETIRSQVWTFDGQRGEIITLTALADFSSVDLDLSLRLLAPDGDEIAYVDDPETSDLLNPLDPQIDALTLADDGQYIVIVESRFSSGRYALGLSQSQTLDISAGGQTINGVISDVVPLQRWLIDGRSGQRLTVTMIATGQSLDPYLRVLNERGEVLDENDDAFDVALGFNAQIEALALPGSGQYIIEAGRFDGIGSYQLEIDIE